MRIPIEATAAALKTLFNKETPWQLEERRGSSEWRPEFVRYREVGLKAIRARLVQGWGRTFLSLSLDGEKAEADETDVPAQLVQDMVNILARQLQPRPVNFMVLGLSGDSTQEIWWE